MPEKSFDLSDPKQYKEYQKILRDYPNACEIIPDPTKVKVIYKVTFINKSEWNDENKED